MPAKSSSPASSPIAPDTRVYSRSGSIAKYLAPSKNGNHLVYPEIEIYTNDGEIEADWGNVTEWHEVFTKAPREVIDSDIVRLTAEEHNLRESINAKQTEIRTIDREITARKDRVIAHEKLALLDTFMSPGGITHYVGVGYRGIDIVAFKDAVCNDRYDYRRDKLKLLTLWGDTKGDLNWCLSEYSSSNFDAHSVVYPRVSLDQARAKAQALFDEQIANWRKPKDARESGIRYPMHDSAVKLGLVVPDDFIAHEKALLVEQAQDNVKRYEKELNEAQAKLKEVQTS